MEGFNKGDVVEHRETGYLCLILKENNVIALNGRDDIGSGAGNFKKYDSSEAIAKDFKVYPKPGEQNAFRKYPRTKEESFTKDETIKSLEKELKVAEELLADRQRLLEAIPECEVRGLCVPHALEWIEKAKKVMEK